MARIGAVELTETPRVAVGFDDKVTPKVIDESIQQGLDIAEVRVDLFSLLEPAYVQQRIKAFSRLATIGTIRSQIEGGKWRGTEEQRLSLFRAITPFVDSLDIELSSDQILSAVVSLCATQRKTLIISHHDFDGTPSLSDLHRIVDRSKQTGADVVKVATMVKSDNDVRVLAELTTSRKSDNLVVIGMGSVGLITRLTFPALGSLMTFAYIGEQTAPGQLHFQDLREDLRRYYPAYNQRLINDLRLMECV